MDGPIGKPAEPTLGKLTPFMLFYLEHRDAVKNRLVRPNSRQHHPYRPADVSRAITCLWRDLDIQGVKEYCMLSNVYAEALEKYGPVNSGSNNINNGNSSTTASSTSANPRGGGNARQIGRSRRKKESRLPTPPVSAYIFFSRHQREILRNEDQELSYCEAGKRIATLWKVATVEEKRPFDDLAAKDKTRYARETIEYRQWLARTRSSKKRKNEELSAASTAVMSTKGATSAAAKMASTATIPAAFGQASSPIASGQTTADVASASDGTSSSVTGTIGGLPLPMAALLAEESLVTLPQKRSAPGPIANMVSNVPMSPETLPLTTSEREEARADPKAMPTSPEAVLDVGAENDVARVS
ncbi:unnamed protein product [Ascophyllum nodosum]